MVSVKTSDARVAELMASMPLKRVNDRRVRRELRRAGLHAALAARRARSIGVANAAGDRRIARGLQRSTQHAARAVTFTVNPPPSHKVRNTVLIVTGAATTVVAVIAIRKAPWRSPEEAPPVADATATVADEATDEATDAEATTAAAVSAADDAE